MNNIDTDTLVKAALEASLASYSPYSRFRVGAALLAKDGTIVTGTNVENRSYGLTMCAERCAIAAAVAQNIREFLAIAIVSPDTESMLPPCGACRQVLSEFGEPGMRVIMHSAGKTTEKTLGELLPYDSLHELKK